MYIFNKKIFLQEENERISETYKRIIGEHFNWLEPCKRGVRFTHYSPLSSVYTCPFWHSWTVTSHHFDTAVTPPAPRASQSRERTAERATHTLKKNFGQFTSPSYYQTNQQPAILIYRRQSCEMCKEYSALNKMKAKENVEKGHRSGYGSLFGGHDTWID